MTQISPGVYDDGKGGMHIDEAELLEANGYADTPENRRMMRKALADYGRESKTPVTEE